MNAKLKKWVRVKVPASSANLGPGYDVLGVALKLYNELEVSSEQRAKSKKRRVQIQIEGEGENTLPKDERNIIWKSIKKVFEVARFPLSNFNFQLGLVNRIPLSRGLGSSAAARLSGILAANALCENFLSRQAVLDLATKLEGHPDNVVPSLVGGWCISILKNGQVEHLRFAPPHGLGAVVCVPDFELSTDKARSVLPKTVPHQDAVYNVAHVSYLLGALFQRNYSRLKNAMQDRLHQIYRKKLVPGFDAVVQRGYEAGALGICLSGAGPSIFAFSPPSKAKRVGMEMEKGFQTAGHKASSRILELNSKGAEITCP